ncbi:MAG: MraY family glycosyltransferase [Candidatus Omnitrophica bacterium]|nr:MraY family glycosyltransferase [Candidatus Omnitrophota bacterium]
MLKYYLLVFLIAEVISLILTPLIKRLSLKMGWMDKPNWRKLNKKPMPLLGGVAIYLGFLVSVLLFIHKAPFVSDIHRLLGALGSSLIIVLTGIVDDIKGLSALRKLFYQVTAAVIVTLFGFTIIKVSSPFGGYFHLPEIVDIALTVFWIVGFINAINLLDGLDGLSSGVVAIISGSLFFTAIKTNNPIAAILSIAICGSCLGFLPYNFYPAKIFMGDSGSMFLGFILAIISIEGAYKGATFSAVLVPVIAMAIPFMDTGLAIIRRTLSGKGIMKADKEHIHHRLLFREGSQTKAVLTLYWLTLSFGLIAIALSGMKGIWAFSAILVTILLTLRWLKNSKLLDFERAKT